MKIKKIAKLGLHQEIETKGIPALQEATGNIYETVNIVAKRANEIDTELKKEFDRRIEDFNFANDVLEEVFENKEQIKISKSYEKLPKSTLVALDEYEKGEISYGYKEKEEN